MLVLSRKKHQDVLVEGGILIRVVDIRGDTVRLGIEAPRSTAITRPDASDQTRKEREE